MALYCLVLFYHAFKEPLAPLNPLSKFMCVKLVIFFSFWQSMIIAGLVHFHKIRYSSAWGTAYTVSDVSEGIQSFLMCGEMLIAAVAHLYAFPISDYKDGVSTKHQLSTSVLHSVSCSDALDDVIVVLGCAAQPGADAFDDDDDDDDKRQQAPADDADGAPEAPARAASMRNARPRPPPPQAVQPSPANLESQASVEADEMAQCGTQMLHAGAAAVAGLTSLMLEKGPRYPYETDEAPAPRRRA